MSTKSICFGVVLIFMAFTACTPNLTQVIPASEKSTKDSVLPTTGSGWESEWEKVVKEAKKEGRVIIYGPPIAETRVALTEAFQKAFPGISLEYVGGRSSEQAPRIHAERRAGIYLVDTHIGGTTTILTALREYAVPIKPRLILPEVKDPTAWLDGKLEFADEAEEINLVFTIYANSDIIHNTELVNPKEITSFWDLVKPKWNGKIIMRDPRTAGGGLAGVTFWYLNKQLGLGYIEAVAANRPTLTRDNRLQVETVAKGKYSLAISPSAASVFEFQEARAPIKFTEIMKEGTFSSASTGTIMVMDKAPHPRAAIVFLNWLLSKEGQTLWTTTSGYPSRRLDAPTGHLSPAMIPKPEVSYLPSYKEKIVMTKDEITPYINKIFAGF